MSGISVKIGNPFFAYLRKHRCPDCAGRMRPIWLHRIANSNDLDADPRDFNLGEISYTPYDDSNIFYWQEFRCEACGRQMAAKQLRDWERLNA